MVLSGLIYCIVSLRKAKFYRRLVFHQSRLFKDLFSCYLSDYFCKDCDLMYTFRSYTATMDLVYSDFYAIVTEDFVYLFFCVCFTVCFYFNFSYFVSVHLSV